MTNPILYKSSCINGSLIAIFLSYAYYKNLLPTYIIAILLTVILTSILNHKITNNLAKWCDRVLAFVAIVALSFCIYKTKTTKLNQYLMFVLLFLICALYLFAKQTNTISNICHLSAHICATILIFLIILNR